METLQVIHTATGKVVYSVGAENAVAVQAAAQHMLDFADGNAGSRAHYVGLKHGTAAAKAAGVLPPVAGDKLWPAYNIGTKLRGLCPVCRKEFALDKTGRLIKHGKVYGRRTDARCKGAKRLPL